MAEDPRQHWPELEQLLRSVVERLGSELTDKQNEWVREFLDHREFGLAYEVLVEAVHDHGLTLGAQDRGYLARAALLMGFASS